MSQHDLYQKLCTNARSQLQVDKDHTAKKITFEEWKAQIEQLQAENEQLQSQLS